VAWCGHSRCNATAGWFGLAVLVSTVKSCSSNGGHFCADLIAIAADGRGEHACLWLAHDMHSIQAHRTAAAMPPSMLLAVYVSDIAAI
jgi:hypothetical protein